MGQPFPSFLMFVCFSTFVVPNSFITVSRPLYIPEWLAANSLLNVPVSKWISLRHLQRSTLLNFSLLKVSFLISVFLSCSRYFTLRLFIYFIWGE